MTADVDLDGLTYLLPELSTREAFAELEAARRAAEQTPPKFTIIPEPEFPHMWPHPKGGIARFPCALGCGWAHEHDSFADDPEPISLPLSAGAEEIGRIFGERAERRAARVRASVEDAIRSHFADEHPGQEPPERRIA
ncbi:hypothetical protein ABZ499_27740 [Streptomyces sp. NPDC019990]|uniref:hypothetical protein n=1 Tax=Streptomyces sp. NPDC019990 TaxID=3154693 RepID=UPI003401F6EF